jgi:hypothetical protein
MTTSIRPKSAVKSALKGVQGYLLRVNVGMLTWSKTGGSLLV